MATVISISSDEEQADEEIKNPRKKRKLEPFVFLDVEQHQWNETTKGSTSEKSVNFADINNVDTQNNIQLKTEYQIKNSSYDILIESDDDQADPAIVVNDIKVNVPECIDKTVKKRNAVDHKVIVARREKYCKKNIKQCKNEPTNIKVAVHVENNVSVSSNIVVDSDDDRDEIRIITDRKEQDNNEGICFKMDSDQNDSVPECADKTVRKTNAVDHKVIVAQREKYCNKNIKQCKNEPPNVKVSVHAENNVSVSSNIVVDSDDEEEVRNIIDPKEQDNNEGICSKMDSDQNDSVSLFKRSKNMQEFINLCLSKINNDDTKKLFKTKVRICKKLFDKMDDKYINSKDFNNFLDDKIASAKNKTISVIILFKDVYQHFKRKLQNNNMNMEISDKHKITIAKLEHVLRKVQKMIIKLEEAEVDFVDEEDSNYIKMQRFRERAVKIYKEICKYKKEDPNAGNLLYNRLDFSGSNYPEFNHAINKKFKNNSVFPIYYDVERCLEKTVRDKNMNIPESRFKEEARECFKNLGNLLQKRRKLDLLNVHSSYLVVNDDPAFENEELEAKLHASSKEAESKMNEICEKYVKLQESGVDPSLSSDSDDSKRESTDDEGI